MTKRKKWRRWTDDEIIEAIQLWAELHGRAPRYMDWKGSVGTEGGTWPSSWTVSKRCGGWYAAIDRAGLGSEQRRWHQQRFDRSEAQRLRGQGLSNREIGRRLGVHGSTIGSALGPKPKMPIDPWKERYNRRYRTTREQRIAALHKALEGKENQ